MGQTTVVRNPSWSRAVICVPRFSSIALEQWARNKAASQHSSRGNVYPGSEYNGDPYYTGQQFLSDTVHSHRLTFFGHLHCADPSQNHHRALQSIGEWGPVTNKSWTIDREAISDRSAWRKLVAMTTSSQICFWRENDSYCPYTLL